MPAFNKRLRETTYAGMKLKPMAGGTFFVVCGLMAFTTIFNNDAWLMGSFLALLSLASAIFGIYEVVNDADWRVRAIRDKARSDRKRKQVVL